MTFYRQTILDRIKSSSDETEVENVVHESIQQLRVQNVNGHSIQRFISDITMNLLRERNGLSSDIDPTRLDSAIKFFRKLRWP